MNVMEESLQKHREWKGKIEVCSRAKVNNAKDLTLAYTPGVAQPCLEIQKDPDLSYELTRRANLVAVITDGSAVLGLGNIGGRYRTFGGNAGYGGKMRTFQGVRRR